VSKTRETRKETPDGESRRDHTLAVDAICEPAEWNAEQRVEDDEGCRAEQREL